MDDIQRHSFITVSYPLLLTRYKSTLIDVLIQGTLIIAIMLLAQVFPEPAMVALPGALLIVLLYEPLLVAFSCTPGQRVMGIRVRDGHDPFRGITLWQSYIRFFSKYLLGWLSFVTIHSNEQKKAIHDMAGVSVVVLKECLD